ncbi:MAG TPA: protein kinase, partial [Verrucomicrobiae bacterium]|nr:protein kinase [Verrucomicrobiae bacterium]
NIKITPDGKVKVLDFGLAKALTTDSTTSRPVDDDSPTITGDHTLPGVVLGTASYMSPEQVRGKPLDKRTDIWSWGCVFFECLTGKRLFRGEDLAETMALIMKSEPAWADLPTTTPSAVALLLRKCLRKDRRHRLQDIGDARVDLEEAIQNPERSEFTGPAGLTSERKLALFALAILIGLLGASLAWALKPSASRREPPPAIRAEVNPFGNQPLGTAGITIALSPNGEWLAYKVGHVTDGSSRILLRNLHDGRDIVLAGTEGGGGPFFHPTAPSWVFPHGRSSGGFRFQPERLASSAI